MKYPHILGLALGLGLCLAAAAPASAQVWDGSNDAQSAFGNVARSPQPSYLDIYGALANKQGSHKHFGQAVTNIGVVNNDNEGSTFLSSGVTNIGDSSNTDISVSGAITGTVTVSTSTNQSSSDLTQSGTSTATARTVKSTVVTNH